MQKYYIFDKKDKDRNRCSKHSMPLKLISQLSQSLSFYLGWFIRYQHTLSSCDGVFYILGMAVPFYSNQMTWRSDLSCRTERDKRVSSSTSKKKTEKQQC